jgi:drug/metabolite transporter (DMT)-like permease
VFVLLRSQRHSFSTLSSERQGLLAVTVAALLWSTGGLFIKWVSLDAIGITGWRSLLAGVTLAVLLRPGWFAPWRVNRLTWGLALSYAAMLLLLVVATRLTTAANAIFLQYAAPFYVLLFGRFFLDEPARRIDAIATVAAFGGMALFFVGRFETDDLWGNAAAIGSGVAFAIFLILLRHKTCTAQTRPRAIVMGNGLLVLVAAGVMAVRGDASALSPGLGEAAALVFLGVIQIGLAYVVFSYGIARVQALEAALVGMLEPVLNPVWVFVVLGETPGWWAVFGGTVIIAAVVSRTVLVERSRRETAAHALPTAAAT